MWLGKTCVQTTCYSPWSTRQEHDARPKGYSRACSLSSSVWSYILGSGCVYRLAGTGLYGRSWKRHKSMLFGLRVLTCKIAGANNSAAGKMLQSRNFNVTRRVTIPGKANGPQASGEVLLPKPVEPGPEDCCQVSDMRELSQALYY
jgi:hypothetical protein